MDQIHGIHHVTAITSNGQRNLDFYSRVLGLRLVKRTVNFDDPSTHHLYYGDGGGTPGTIITFFVWPDGQRGRHGIGQVGSVAFAIPSQSLAYWIGRLIRMGVRYDGPAQRWDEQVVSFRDPDGLLLELIADPRAPAVKTWAANPVPIEHMIRGLHSVTLWEDGHAASEALLTEALGFRFEREAGSYRRYIVGSDRRGAQIDLRSVSGFWPGAVAVGTVHHVAWRVATEADQIALRMVLEERGVNVTPVLDRQYFRSVYFREPGGVLFEIATDGPGFAIDEPVDHLGTRLMLPPWLDADRTRIEAQLAPIDMSIVDSGGSQ